MQQNQYSDTAWFTSIDQIHLFIIVVHIGEIGKNKNIVINDLEDIRKEDPLQYENLKSQNIHSLVVVPLYNEKKVIGFYGADNPPEGFSDYVSDMLQIMGHFIISSLKRRNLVKRLRHMSHTDQLTGLGNRYAVEEQIENMSDVESKKDKYPAARLRDI